MFLHPFHSSSILLTTEPIEIIRANWPQGNFHETVHEFAEISSEYRIQVSRTLPNFFIIQFLELKGKKLKMSQRPCQTKTCFSQTKSLFKN